MEAINACILFLAVNAYYFVGAFTVYLVFIGQAVYCFFRLDRPEIRKEFTPYEIEMTRERIGRHLLVDIVVTSILFLLMLLSLGLKLWFSFFPPVISLIK